MRGNIRIAVVAVVAFISGSAAAQTLPAPTLSIPRTSSSSFDWGFSTGIDYVAGNYGAKCAVSLANLTCTTTGTTVFEIPATAMLQLGRLRLEATVPYVDIEGPGKFAGNFGLPLIVAPASNEPKHRSGLGDFSLGAAWLIAREGTVFPAVEIAGITKLPTAGSGLGTGKTDYGAQVNLYRTLAPGLTAYGSLGYMWIGDINTIKLHSGARATAGADFKFLSYGLGAMVDFQRSTWQGAPSYATLNPYLTWHIIGGLGLQLYTTVGLTSSSPSHGFGVRLIL
ncbi:MAG: hypothetical protein JO256_06725 [Alphaproteobacteria bacterium]|nr:hypothetical protein [Alphaproteobacteria bacterium]